MTCAFLESAENASRWYPAKRALSAMRKHGGLGPFGRIPFKYDLMFPK